MSFFVHGRNDTSTLYCIAQAGVCTLQPYQLNIAYKPLMVDQVALAGLCIRGLLMQEPTLSLDVARSPLMYDLSYSLEAILQMGS